MTIPRKDSDPTEAADVAGRVGVLAKTVPGQPGDPPYVDDRELERRTPMRRITWQTWRRQGVGPPYYRARRRCVYRWAEVVAWLESHRVGGAAGADPRSAGS